MRLGVDKFKEACLKFRAFWYFIAACASWRRLTPFSCRQNNCKWLRGRGREVDIIHLPSRPPPRHYLSVTPHNGPFAIWLISATAASDSTFPLFPVVSLPPAVLIVCPLSSLSSAVSWSDVSTYYMGTLTPTRSHGRGRGGGVKYRDIVSPRRAR